jgi:hypothetical protein
LGLSLEFSKTQTQTQIQNFFGLQWFLILGIDLFIKVRLVQQFIKSSHSHDFDFFKIPRKSKLRLGLFRKDFLKTHLDAFFKFQKTI